MLARVGQSQHEYRYLGMNSLLFTNIRQTLFQYDSNFDEVKSSFSVQDDAIDDTTDNNWR